MVSFHSPIALDLYRQIRSRVAQRENQSAEPTAPRNLDELVLNIAKGCNLNCPYCFADAGMYGSDKSSWMSKSDAYSFTIKMLRAHPTIRRIKLFGGEPFMNIPALEGCAEAVSTFLHESDIQRTQLSVGCVTNMTICSPRIARLARDMNLNVTASVDGPIDIHDKNRRFRNGRGSYNRIKANIERYRDAGVNIAGIECVYSPAHMDAKISILDLHKFLIEEFRTPRVIISPLQGAFEDQVGEAEFVRWVRACAEEYMREAVRLREAHNSYKAVMDEQMGVAFSNLSNLGWCGLGTTTLTVDVDGGILPCYTLLYEKEDWQMGSLSAGKTTTTDEQNSIAIKLHDANPRITDSCSSCDIREVCRGCPGGVFAARGSFTGIDPVGCAYRIGVLEGLFGGWNNEAKSS